MNRHRFGAGVAMTAVIISLVACSSASTGGSTTAATTGGAACNSDSDCPSGMLCLQPAIGAGTDKYCAPSCTQDSDCVAFAETSYSFTVPDTVTPQGGSPTPTVFKTKTLGRGYACGAVAGQASTYCQFACSNTEALSADGHCYCLPGYELNADKTACVFGQDIQCSILSFLSPDDQKKAKDAYGIEVANPSCDACDSSMSFCDQYKCHTGLFGCEINDIGMKGRCAEFLTPQAFNACISNATNFSCNCDNSCASSCDLNDVNCIDNCCTCTPAPGTPAPTCGAGGGDAGGDDAADGSG